MPLLRFARTLSLLTLAVALLLPALHAAKSKKNNTQVDPAKAYKGAVIMDASTGAILFEDRADVVTPPASMTKLMTFAVISDRLAAGGITLQTPITVTAPDTRIGGTQVWLKEGEIFPLEELLYAMMIQSANDASYALARTCAGSQEAFIRLMNEKARALGMTHTTFRTAHGLPPADRDISKGDLTSPRDFALLCRHLLTNTDVLKYCSVKRRNFGSPQRVQPVVMDNHNHLLAKVSGVDGLKTGFTNGAGFCLSATALRDNRRIIVVVMGSPDKRTRDNKVIELLEQGFAEIPASSPAFQGRTAPAASPFSASTGDNQNATAPAENSPFAPAPISDAAGTATDSNEEPLIRFNPPPAPKKSGAR